MSDDHLTPERAAQKYKSAIHGWRSAVDGDSFEKGELDADALEQHRTARLEAMQDILELGCGGRSDLKDVRSYMAADLAALERPKAHEEAFDQFLMRRAQTRQRLLETDRVEAGGVDGAEAYVESCRKVAMAIRNERAIGAQYDILAVRREAALENFDDPRFIAQIATKHSEYLDEMFVDFGVRTSDQLKSPDDGREKEGAGQTADALLSQAEAASRHRAKALSDSTIFVKRDGRSRVAHFAEISATAEEVRHDPHAIAEFARKANPEPGVTPGMDARQYELGMLALENRVSGAGNMQKWIETLSPEDKRPLKKDQSVAGIYKVARQKFIREYDKTPPGQDLLLSYGVMRRAAEKINADDGMIQAMAETAEHGELADLALFNPRHTKKLRERAATYVDKGVEEGVAWEKDGRRAAEGSGNEIEDESRKAARAAPLHSGKATAAPRQDGEAYELDLEANAASAEIRVIDGGRLRVSNNREDMEAGKYVDLRVEGMLAPPPGTATRGGNLDAGVEAKAHLEDLLARHDASSIAVSAKDATNGAEPMAQVRLNGEDLAQRMIRDGYAVPSGEGGGKVRKQEVARQAEAGRRGLWKDGFAEVDESWRPENESPVLAARDRKQRLHSLIGMSMPGNARNVEHFLSRREAKLFGLPVARWSRGGDVDARVERVAERNPGRLKSILANNEQILGELRGRKDKLTREEKHNHDRLTLGSQVLSRSLLAKGHISEDEARKADQPLLSERAKYINLEKMRRGIAKGTKKGLEAADDVYKEAAPKAARALGSLMDEAMR